MFKILRCALGAVLMCALVLVPAAGGIAQDAPLCEEVLTQTVSEEAMATAKTTSTTVKNKLVIREDTVIEADEMLSVSKGGALYIMDGVTLTVKGKLRCSKGGEIYCRGKIDAVTGSKIYDYGKIKILSMGELKLSGKIWVYEGGEIKGLGKLTVTNLFSDIYCRGTVTAKIAAPKAVTKNGVTSVGGIIIANKQYSLPKDYGTGLNKSAYSAFLKMKEDSGFDMKILSGFRSYEKQEGVFDYWCSIDGVEKASVYSARPGESEHQTGLAMDITSLNQSYGKTAEGKWLAANCWKYGFIIRYPQGKEDITGYMYEPWHVRYLNVSMAKMVYDSKLTLEEFLGLA